MIYLRTGKTTEAKPHQVNLRSRLSRIHYYQNKRLQVKESQYLRPTYSWTLTPIPNWTCNVVTISHFQCTDPSMWLTHQLVKDVGCKVLQFIYMMKIKKFLGHKTLRHTNPAISSKERWTRANCLWSQYAWIKPLHQVFINWDNP